MDHASKTEYILENSILIQPLFSQRHISINSGYVPVCGLKIQNLIKIIYCFFLNKLEKSLANMNHINRLDKNLQKLGKKVSCMLSQIENKTDLLMCADLFSIVWMYFRRFFMLKPEA
jgi:hypothetical protein